VVADSLQKFLLDAPSGRSICSRRRETSSHTIGIGGRGRPASPATPPYMRVRIRRFGGLS